jgi:heptosyltransferase-1
MHFLISRLSSLGDVVCSLPAAVCLKTTFPESTITWVVDKKFAGVLKCCPSVDTIVPIKLGWSPETWPRFDQQFDVGLDLQGLLKSAVAIAKARCKRRLGYHWLREGAWMFTQPVLPDPTSYHVVDQYVDVARAAGGQVHRANFGVTVSDDILADVRRRLHNDGIDRFVALNAGAGWATKRWPEHHFSELADRLAADGVGVLLIGGKLDADFDAGERVIAHSKTKPTTWVGQTSIEELFALMSLCECHVGGDTGSTHITAAVGRPCVGLYSITNPRRSCPYGQIDNCIYEPKGLACIPVDRVHEKVLGVLAQC